MFFFKHKQSGFSLIELMVVIAIIGILSTIIVASLSASRAKGRDARRVADIKGIQLALSLYYNDNAMYPSNIYAAAGTAPGGGLAPTYIPRVPSDPNSSVACTSGTQSSCYVYMGYSVSSANCNASNPPVSYHLGAMLEDAGNGALMQDVDAGQSITGLTACTFGASGNRKVFEGTSAGTAPSGSTAGTGCSTTAGTPQPGGTETCYDQTP